MKSSAPECSSTNLLALLAAVPDPRRRPRRNVYPLVNILFITLAGTLAGMKGWAALANFAEVRRDWLATYLDLSAGLPPARTLERVISSLRPETFEGLLQRLVATLCGALRDQVVALDGKASRGVVDPATPTAPLYHLHVWAAQQGLVLAMKTIAGAPAESPAARDLLPQLAIRGATVTGDANFCTQANTAVVRACRAHYQLTLKGNRGPLHAAVKAALRAPAALRARGVVVSKHVTRTDGHGRRERRTVWAVNARAAGVSTTGWTDLVTIAKIKRERTTLAGREVKVHYLISSRAPDAARLARENRRHWSVENHLHWHLDVHFGEDDSRIRDRVAGQNLATARRLALMLLKRDTTFEASIPQRMLRATMSPAYLDHLLSLATTQV